MSYPQLKRAKVGFAKVRAILHGEWDPIGCGVPEDEYDSYAWPVIAMLKRKADRSDIEAYLLWAADENMRCPVPAERLVSVLDRLMVLEVE